MCKFIEIEGNMLNVADIRKVEFISNDINEQLLPLIKEEYVSFNYCNIHTFNGEVFKLMIDLHQIEKDMPIDEWVNINKYHIHQSLGIITEILKPVKVTGFEYE